MNFNKIFPILIAFLSFNVYSQGERYKEKKEQIKAMKVAYITSELNLTSNEAEKFWPIYNTFDDKQFELKHKKIKTYLNKMDDDEELNKLSEKDAIALLNQIENNEEELFLLRKKFITSLKGILPAVKIIKLRKAEEGFNRKLLQQYRDKAQKK
jgi:alpha-galactosidase/6-phospho-beta-glucosidase family protein